jgi:predicted PurR-regulated permease PerM
MPLTLSQFLLLVLTIAAVVAVTFLVNLFIQLKKTSREGQETLVEIRSLAENLNEITRKIDDKIDDVSEVVEAAKKTAGSLSEIAVFAAVKVIRPASRFWPFLVPFIRMGWRLWKKKKEDKNE